MRNFQRTIPFSPPDISETEIEEVVGALRSGWITTGPRTKELEKKIANWLGVEKCVCLNSQTACAELTLRILGITQGDEVITTAYTYTATASAISHVGATIVLVDVKKDSLEMDYDKLELCINSKTKAIIPVDIAGIPCDYEKIFDIIKRKKNLFRPVGDVQKKMGRIAVVADAAHSLGASYKNNMIGNVADFTNFSFHAVKNFTTAEGGACAWKSISGINNEQIYKMFQLLSLHGQSKDALTKTRLGAWEYDVLGLYYKCNMTDVSAAIGLKQFERYPDMLIRRKEIIEKYDGALKPLGIRVLKHFTEVYESSGHLYITRIPGINAIQRNEIIDKMAKQGIACNVHYKPLPLLTAYKNMGFEIEKYPNAYSFFENEITLPLHTSLSNEDVDYVIENYIEILKEYKVENC